MSFAKIAQAAGLAAVGMYAVGCKDDENKCNGLEIELTDAQAAATDATNIALAIATSTTGTDSEAITVAQNFCWACVYSRPGVNDATCGDNTAKTAAQLKTLFTTAVGECDATFKQEDSAITFAATQPCTDFVLALNSGLDYDQMQNAVVTSSVSGGTGNPSCSLAFATLELWLAYGAGDLTFTEAASCQVNPLTDGKTVCRNKYTCESFQSFACITGGTTTGSCSDAA